LKVVSLQNSIKSSTFTLRFLSLYKTSLQFSPAQLSAQFLVYVYIFPTRAKKSFARAKNFLSESLYVMHNELHLECT
jgi:hypothetical protein